MTRVKQELIIVDGQEMKYCPMCELPKPVSEFYCVGNRYYTYCKKCAKIRALERYKKERMGLLTKDASQEKLDKIAKKYNREHPFFWEQHGG